MTRRKKVITSLLAAVILSTVITVGASKIYPTNFNKAKNSIVNVVQNFSWGWTGFSGKTLWDVLELSSRLAIPVLIAVFTYIVQKRDKEKTEEQAELEREIARNNLAEEAIQAYLDNMAKLLLDKQIRKELFPNNELKLILNKELKKDKLKFLDKENNDNPVRDVARTQTITILRRLEGNTKHQERILDFLYDAELYNFIFQNANLSKIDLSQANLKDAKLQDAYLVGANLQKADLTSANLQNANLKEINLQDTNLMETNLQDANLERTNLQNANLERANLQNANLWRANLQKADLLKANLQNTHLQDTKLQNAKLWKANLQEANLVEANLQNAELWSANLQKADLTKANLKKADLWRANLQNADLEGANLQEATLVGTKNLTPKQIKSTCFWDRAIYKGKWNEEEKTWVAIEPDNTKYIDKLRNNTASDPYELIDCSYWEKKIEVEIP